jgi:RNA polymerase sigma-70 factor (ECF subfamily)
MQADIDPGALERARSGDSSAFDLLVEARVGPMLRTAMAITGNESEARDAVQDSLVAAWRELAALRDPGAFDAWLTRILVNRCRRGLRRASRVRVHEVSVELVAEAASPSAPDIAGGVADRQALERAFDRLSVDERTILALHHLDGRAVADLARVLDVPVGTAKSRLFGARRALERSLERERPR